MYTQQNLTDGTVLTAAHLDYIDDGIAANETAAIAAVSKVDDVNSKLSAISQSA